MVVIIALIVAMALAAVSVPVNARINVAPAMEIVYPVVLVPPSAGF